MSAFTVESRIFEALRVRQMTVGEISDFTHINPLTVLQYLRVMKSKQQVDSIPDREAGKAYWVIRAAPPAGAELGMVIKPTPPKPNPEPLKDIQVHPLSPVMDKVVENLVQKVLDNETKTERLHEPCLSNDAEPSVQQSTASVEERDRPSEIAQVAEVPATSDEIRVEPNVQTASETVAETVGERPKKERSSVGPKETKLREQRYMPPKKPRIILQPRQGEISVERVCEQIILHDDSDPNGGIAIPLHLVKNLIMALGTLSEEG